MAPRSGHCPNRRPLAVRTAGEAGETKPQSPAEIALHPASSILYHIFLPPSNPFLRCPIPPLKAKIRLPMPLPRAMAGFGLRHRPRKIFLRPIRGSFNPAPAAAPGPPHPARSEPDRPHRGDNSGPCPPADRSNPQSAAATDPSVASPGALSASFQGSREGPGERLTASLRTGSGQNYKPHRSPCQ